MTVIRWSADSILTKMETVPYGKKGEEAVLYAHPQAQQGQLAGVPDMLRAQGYDVIPDTEGEEFVLRIRGFKNVSDVASALEVNGFANPGTRTQEAGVATRKKEKVNPKDKLREQSVKLAGITYLVGDAALISSGLIRKDYNEAASGAGYMSASAVLARYGNRKPEKAFNDLYERMLSEFQHEGVELPDYTTTTPEDLGKPGGLVERIEKFLYKNPVEVNRVINAFGGFQLLKAGKQQGNFNKTMAGVMATTAMLTCLFVPQKKKPKSMEDLAADFSKDGSPTQLWKAPVVEDRKGVFGTLLAPVRKVADWVQADPMKAGSYIAMSNNVFLAAGTVKDRAANIQARENLPGQIAQENDPTKREALQADLDKAEASKFSWMFSALASAAYFTANGMMSLSKGGGKKGEKKEDPYEDLYAAAAAILSSQPEQVQDAMINKMAAFLSEQREIEAPASDIASYMRDKLEQQKVSPWLARAAQQAAAQDPGIAR